MPQDKAAPAAVDLHVIPGPTLPNHERSRPLAASMWRSVRDSLQGHRCAASLPAARKAGTALHGPISPSRAARACAYLPAFL